MAIGMFADKKTKKLFEGRHVRSLGTDLVRRVHRALQQLNGAQRLSDMAVPPGRHLESLSGDRAGQHSVRVNAQWRICFRWADGDAYEVEFCDYH